MDKRSYPFILNMRCRTMTKFEQTAFNLDEQLYPSIPDKVIINIMNNEKITVDHIMQEENFMRKARLIKRYREQDGIPYIHYTDLAEELFEVDRQIYRLMSLNNLIPEFQALLENKSLAKFKAYFLATCDEEMQRNIYVNFIDGMEKSKKAVSQALSDDLMKRMRERKAKGNSNL